MKDLDKRLHNLGERWRGAQPDPAPVDPTTFRELGPPSLMWPAFKTIVGPIVTIVVLGGIITGRALILNRSTSQTGDQAGIVEPGDDVFATGIVVADAEGVTRICDPSFVLLGGGSAVECPPISVAVRGLHTASLSGWTEIGGGGYSSLVTVSGTWEAHALQAIRTSAASSPVPVPSQVPCAAPVDGWPSNAPSEFDYEAALLRLDQELQSNRTRVTGYWVAAQAGGESAFRVAVVGTVGKPEDIRADLEATFPYPLCVLHVQYSAADLERAAALLSRPDRTWDAEISNERDRVVVRLPVMDEAAQAIFDAHPEAVGDPLVQRK